VISPEGMQMHLKCRAGPPTGVAVHFAPTIAFVHTCPFVDAVLYCGMGRMAAVIILQCIGV
jgi:hypothetical protein